jgi:hypothetical protein
MGDTGVGSSARRRQLLEPLLIGTAVLAVYLASPPRTNQLYRHFVSMAEAFLDGRVDLRGLPAVAVWRRGTDQAQDRGRRHRRLRPVWWFLAVNALGGAAYPLYNALRFGAPLQTGYSPLTVAAPNAEAVHRWGFFNPRFVPEHLFTMLLRGPELIEQPPFLRPSPWGMSLVITSPVVARMLFPRSSLQEAFP